MSSTARQGQGRGGGACGRGAGFCVDGDATFAPADVNEQPPATMSLFFWRGGDDLSGQGEYVYYRWFCSTGRFARVGYSLLAIAAHDMQDHILRQIEP